ncbi:MAG: hypothetical protein WBR56_03645, partial [Sedimenticolaceae bacterium]
MKTQSLIKLALGGILATSLMMPTWADKLPTDPIGGKPPAGTGASFKNFATFKDQVLYQRAFEA